MPHAQQPEGVAAPGFQFSESNERRIDAHMDRLRAAWFYSRRIVAGDHHRRGVVVDGDPEFHAVVGRAECAQRA